MVTKKGIHKKDRFDLCFHRYNSEILAELTSQNEGTGPLNKT